MKRPENGHLDHTSGKCFIFPKIHQPDLPAIFRDEAILPFTENFGYYLAYAFLPSQTRTSWLLGKGLAGFIHSWYLAYTSGRCPPESVMNVVFVGKGCWFTNSWYFDKISRFVNSLFVFKKCILNNKPWKNIAHLNRIPCNYLKSQPKTTNFLEAPAISNGTKNAWVFYLFETLRG